MTTSTSSLRRRAFAVLGSVVAVAGCAVLIAAGGSAPTAGAEPTTAPSDGDVVRYRTYPVVYATGDCAGSAPARNRSAISSTTRMW